MENIDQTVKRTNVNEVIEKVCYSLLLIIGLYNMIKDGGSSISTILLCIANPSESTYVAMLPVCIYNLVYSTVIIWFSVYNLFLKKYLKSNIYVQGISAFSIIILFLMRKIQLLAFIVSQTSQGEVQLFKPLTFESIIFVANQIMGEPKWVAELTMLLIAFTVLLIISIKKQRATV